MALAAKAAAHEQSLEAVASALTDRNREVRRRAVEALRVEPSRTPYVGDSIVDAEAAARAGLRFIAVLSGVTPREAFETYAPAAVLPSVRELPALLGTP